MRRQRVTPTIAHRSSRRARHVSTILFVACLFMPAAAAGAQPLSFSADHYAAAIGARAISRQVISIGTDGRTLRRPTPAPTRSPCSSIVPAR